MNIPNSYPAKPPEVNFITKISHPLVDIKSGKLDLSVFYLNNLFFIQFRKNSRIGKLVKISLSKLSTLFTKYSITQFIYKNPIHIILT